jgi:hypothetical protein
MARTTHHGTYSFNANSISLPLAWKRAKWDNMKSFVAIPLLVQA